MQQPETWAGATAELGPPARVGLDAQRALDLTLTILALPLALPLAALVALAIKLDSPGPVLFRQERLGRQGQRFEMLKLRTMRAGSSIEPHQAHVRRLLRGAAAERPWKRLDRDPRVTRAGAWLRRSGLDELPQLINVLRGQMSLVGPRPALPYEADLWQDWHHGRLAVRPGITGLWQVEGRDRVDFDGMVRLDLEYVRRRSLILDLEILARTPAALLPMRDKARRREGRA